LRNRIEACVLVRARSAQDRPDCAHDDSQIEPGTELCDVAQIPLDALVPAHLVAALDLRQPGHPGPDAQSAELSRLVPLHLVGQCGPGPDQAHLAAQHVDELRQFVGGDPAQDPADPGDPGHIGQHLAGWPGRRHRAQLDQDKGLAAAADADLAEQHGRPIGHHYGQRADRPQGQCRERHHGQHRQVEDAFSGMVRINQVRRWPEVSAAAPARCLIGAPGTPLVGGHVSSPEPG